LSQLSAVTLLLSGSWGIGSVKKQQALYRHAWSWPKWSTTGRYVQDVVVYPDRQWQGMGTALMVAAMAMFGARLPLRHPSDGSLAGACIAGA
jgi:hypothetical protein